MPNDKTPKAPPINASKAEHKKHAKEILEMDEYKHKPVGFPDEAHEIEEANP